MTNKKSNEQFLKFFFPDEMTQPKTLQETLRENRIKTLNEDARRKHLLKKEQVKNHILTTIIAIFIILTTITLLSKQYGQAVDKCSQKHSKSYCERVLA